MIILYQYELSPFCDKIRRVLHVKGVPYQAENLSPSDTLWRLKKITPIGKLPCLRHEGKLITDSTDIAHYLEERYPDPPLIPKEPKLAAQCHVLEDWADEALYFHEMWLRFGIPANVERWLPILAARENWFFKLIARQAVPRYIDKILQSQGLGKKPPEAILADLRRHIQSLAGWLDGSDWLLGDGLTLGDIAVFAQLSCIGGTPEGARLIAAKPQVKAWMDRVDAGTAPAQAP